MFRAARRRAAQPSAGPLQERLDVGDRAGHRLLVEDWPEAPGDDGCLVREAVEWLRVLGTTWRDADVPEAKAELLHAIYERITVAGPMITSARLTPSAYAHGLALVLPQVVMARPTGFNRADDIYIRMPIEGAGDWLTSSESA